MPRPRLSSPLSAIALAMTAGLALPAQAPPLGPPRLLGTPLRSHGGAAPEHVEYTRDGALVLVGALGPVARVFDARTGALVAECKGKDGALATRARWCGPKQEFVAVTFDGDGLRVFDRATGKQRAAIAGSRGLTVAPDGATLAVAKGQDLLVVDPAGKPKATVKLGLADGTPEFTADGKRVLVTAFAKDRGAVEHIVDLAAKKVTGQQPAPELRKRVPLPDGKAVLEVRGLRLCKLAVPGGEELAVYRLPFGPSGVAVCRGGAEVLIGGLDGAIRHLDLESGRELHAFAAHTAMVNRFALSPDEQQFVSASADGTVRFWDLGSGEQLHRAALHDAAVTALAFAPDAAALVAAGHDGSAVRWPVDGRQPAKSATGAPVLAVAAAADGHWTIGRDNTLVRHDPAGAETTRETLAGKYAFGLVAVATADALVTGHRDGTVQWRNLTTGEELRRGDHHTNGVQALAADAKGEVVVSGGVDGKLVIWDAAAATPRHQVPAHEGGVLGVCLLPEGAALSCGNGREIKRWDLAKGEVAGSTVLPKDKGEAVGVAALAGRNLAAVACTDRLVLLQLPGLQPAGEIDLPAGPTSIAAAPDGRALAVGLADGTIALWQLQ